MPKSPKPSPEAPKSEAVDTAKAVASAQSEMIALLKEQLEMQGAEIERLRKKHAEPAQAQDARTEILELLKVHLDKDPYSRHRPYEILGTLPPDDESPSGWALTWANPRYRAVMGWRGLIPIRWDDKYAEKLHMVLPDPPPRMQGPDHMDGYVRRGDRILCRIPKEVAESRKAIRELRVALELGELRDPSRDYSQGKEKWYGDAMQDDENPYRNYGRKLPDVDWDKETGLGTRRFEFDVNPKEQETNG